MIEGVVAREVSLLLRGRRERGVFVSVTHYRLILFIKAERVVCFIHAVLRGYFEAFVVYQRHVASDAHYFLPFNNVPGDVLRTLLRTHHLRIKFKLEHGAVGRGVDVFGCGRLGIALRKHGHVKLSQTHWLYGLALLGSWRDSRKKLNFLINLQGRILGSLRKLTQD